MTGVLFAAIFGFLWGNQVMAALKAVCAECGTTIECYRHWNLSDFRLQRDGVKRQSIDSFMQLTVRAGSVAVSWHLLSLP
jgi:hypothetical protein